MGTNGHPRLSGRTDHLYVTVSDWNNDPITVAWAFKDGPNKTDKDVGDLLVLPGGFAVSWKVYASGVYYLHVEASDDRGGVAQTVFKMRVRIE